MFETLRLTRSLYNAGLEQRIAAYKKQGKTLSVYDQQAELVAIKAACPEFKVVYNHVLQDVFDRLERAYRAFFSRVSRGKKKVGFPRFKSRERWNSFKYKQCWDNKQEKWRCGGPTSDGSRISVPKIGSVKIKFHRPLEGKPKTLDIVFEVGQWYAVYACEVEKTPLPATGSSVGVDVGTTWFAITSDGEFVENPRYLKTGLKKLRVQSRTLARRKKGSNRRRKAVRIVAKLHRKVSRQRLDFHHKTAVKLVRENDLIAHEDLQVGNMIKSNLARSISDVGWSQFFSILSQKAECAARKIVAVDPRYTSQECSQCGHACKENRASQAKFVCVQCGHTANADVNAARNILARAEPSGINVAISSARVA